MTIAPSPTAPPGPGRAIALCAVIALANLGFSNFAALVPQLQPEWSLSNPEVGWVGGVYHATNGVLGLFLIRLADRMAPARLIVIGMALNAVAGLGFWLLTESFWTAMLFRGLGGIAMAMVFLPGSIALAEWYRGPGAARVTALYVSMFQVGVAASFALTGAIAAALGARAGLSAAPVGSILGCAIAWLFLPHGEPVRRRASGAATAPPREGHPLAYVIGYGAHMWEMIGVRTWLVAFLTFYGATSAGAGTWQAALGTTALAAILTLTGPIATMAGGEFAARWGLRRVTIAGMGLSAAATLAVGLALALPPWLMIGLLAIQNMTIMADAGTLNAGAIVTSPPHLRGRTMAYYGSFGPLCGLASPLAFGVVLDLGGGQGSAAAWQMAFAALAALPLVGVAVLAIMRRRA